MEYPHIILNKAGYEPFIDFIKFYAILWVILGHVIPVGNDIWYPLIGGMQVPLFLLVQTFHSYKREQRPINLKSITKKIILPFVLIQAIAITVLALRTDEPLSLIKSIVVALGVGPGSYYIYIYIQFAILLALLRPVFEKFENWSLLIFLVLCTFIEIVCCQINLPVEFYRVLAVRYVFLIYLGYQWTNKGISLTPISFIGSLVGIAAIALFSDTTINLEPFFITNGWRTHKWPCFLYVAYLFPVLLYYIYKITCRISSIQATIKTIAASSFEIFLCQMGIIAVFNSHDLTLFGNGTYNDALWALLVFILSIFLGIQWYKLKTIK